MSREIKFRCWDKKDKKWVEDVHIYLDGGFREFSDDDGGKSGLWEHDDSKNENLILMQYTGLKDKNGKKIYENDILDHYATSGAVIFEDGMFCLNMSAKVNFGHRQPLCYIDVSQSEIIGNIYENP